MSIRRKNVADLPTLLHRPPLYQFFRLQQKLHLFAAAHLEQSALYPGALSENKGRSSLVLPTALWRKRRYLLLPSRRAPRELLHLLRARDAQLHLLGSPGRGPCSKLGPRILKPSVEAALATPCSAPGLHHRAFFLLSLAPPQNSPPLLVRGRAFKILGRGCTRSFMPHTLSHRIGMLVPLAGAAPVSHPSSGEECTPPRSRVRLDA